MKARLDRPLAPLNDESHSAPFPIFEAGTPPLWLDRRRISRSADSAVAAAVRETIAEVRGGGDQAVLRLTEQFDGVRLAGLRVAATDLEDAYAAVDRPFIDALRDSISTVRAFHTAQITVELQVETVPGVKAWRIWRPIERVGLYVPGGRARYPSSVVMLGVAAQVAGCRERVLATPPGPEGKVPAETLVAAAEVGITEIYSVGGAQAIAALAYGTESVRRVDKIFGPGNAYVTAAKLAVFPDVSIDMPAGPSELMIVADDSSNPEWIAADMLGNAEHAPDSPVVLVTPSRDLAGQVALAVSKQMQSLPRATFARSALENCGGCALVSTVDEAFMLANDFAPEHLQLMVEDARGALGKVLNAGSVFLGGFSPNAVGDYATGTNHVLPTGGYARAFQALSVEAFGRMMQVQELNWDGIQRLTPTIARLARAEGLEGHARAAEIRASGGGDER